MNFDDEEVHIESDDNTPVTTPLPNWDQEYYDKDEGIWVNKG